MVLAGGPGEAHAVEFDDIEAITIEQQYIRVRVHEFHQGASNQVKRLADFIGLQQLARQREQHPQLRCSKLPRWIRRSVMFHGLAPPGDPV
jgi:hypothetical protein